jgi:hypothetical protein
MVSFKIVITGNPKSSRRAPSRANQSSIGALFDLRDYAVRVTRISYDVVMAEERNGGAESENRRATEREHFQQIHRRPGMYLGWPSFHMATAYLDGYAAHARLHGGPGLDGWPAWVVARRGRECNHGWPGQVLHIALPEGFENIAKLSPEQEQRAVDVLFELLDEFLAGRPAERSEAAGSAERSEAAA